MSNKEVFLLRYLRWCQDEIREEIESGMPNLSWVGHPIFDFLCEYVSRKSSGQAADALFAMLCHKLSQQGVKWPGEDRARAGAVLGDFQEFVREQNSRRAQDIAEAIRMAKFEVAKSSVIKRMAWRSLKPHGWQMAPWNPGILKCSMRVSRVTVNTFLSAETKGFCYWQQVISDSEDILLETSFAEWFGLGYYTMFAANERGSEDRISEFVVEKCQYFAAELRTLLDPPT